MILAVRTGRSFSKNADPVNDRCKGQPVQACLGALLWGADSRLLV